MLPRVLNDVSQLELILHLLLVIGCLFGCNSCEILGAVGKDDGAACVHKQTAIVVHTLLADLLERTALCAHTGNEQEVCRNNGTYILE